MLVLKVKTRDKMCLAPSTRTFFPRWTFPIHIFMLLHPTRLHVFKGFMNISSIPFPISLSHVKRIRDQKIFNELISNASRLTTKEWDSEVGRGRLRICWCDAKLIERRSKTPLKVQTWKVFSFPLHDDYLTFLRRSLLLPSRMLIHFTKIRCENLRFFYWTRTNLNFHSSREVKSWIGNSREIMLQQQTHFNFVMEILLLNI